MKPENHDRFSSTQLIRAQAQHSSSKPGCKRALIILVSIPLVVNLVIWSILSLDVAIIIVAPPVVISYITWLAVKSKWKIGKETYILIGVIFTTLWVYVAPEVGYLSFLGF